MGASSDRPVILLLCRLVWEKALDVYIDVIRNLEKEQIPHVSVVVGDGPARSGMEVRIAQCLSFI